MSADLGEEDVARIVSGGFEPLSSAEGVALFDAAGGVADAVLIPAKINIKTIRANATAGMVHPMLRGLIGSGVRRAAGAGADLAGALRQRLAGMSEAECDRVVLELVRTHAAAVLRHPSAEDVDPERGFMEVGFDSLTALDLRNRLAVATGLKLPATLMFDYPRPAVLARHLRTLLSPATESVPSVTTPVLDQLTQLEDFVSSLPGDEILQTVTTRLRRLLSRCETAGPADVEIDDATAEELFNLIDMEVGE
jgi:acyl carrier protein